MTNPFFDFVVSASRFVPRTKARAEDVNARLDEVTVGFDGVNTALALKAPLASPALTGVVDLTGATSVLLPSVALAEATMTKAATLQYAQDVLGAAGALIPPQAGHAGKVLQTDGAVYSWQLKYPSQTGHSRKVLRSDGTDPAWVNPSGGYLAVTVSVSLTADQRLVDITDSTAGIMVTLPDARTMLVGEQFIVDGSATNQGILDNTGTLISTAGKQLVLADASTQAGTWMSITSGTNISALSSAVSINGPDSTFVASMNHGAVCAIDATHYLCAYGNSGAVSGLKIFIATVDTAALTVTPGSITTAGTDYVHWIKLFAVTGGWICLYEDNSTNLRALAITVSGSTITAGSISTIAADFLTTHYMDAAVHTDTVVALLTNVGATSLRALAVKIDTGTTLTVGAEVTPISGVTTVHHARVVGASATTFQFVAAVTSGGTATARAGGLSVSGVTITVGTVTTGPTLFGVATNPLAIANIDATSALVSYVLTGTGDINTCVVSAMTTTPVFNTANTLASSSWVYLVLKKVGSYYALAAEGFADAARLFSVSGTTVSTVGSSVTPFGTFTSAYTGSMPFLDWDGTYIVAPYGGFLGLFSANASGIALVTSNSTAGGGYSQSGGTYGNSYHFKVATGVYVVFRGAAASGIVAKFGSAVT